MVPRDVSPGFVSSRRRLLELQLQARGIADKRVIAAIAAVPRELFVTARAPETTVPKCADVARALEVLQPRPADRVLELGSGSAYVAAVTSQLVAEVYALEPDAERAEAARDQVEALGYACVAVGASAQPIGWIEHAPYDGILVMEAGEQPAPVLLAQLAIGGRLVMPTPSDGGLRLLRVTRTGAVTFDSYEDGWFVESSPTRLAG